MHVFSHVGLSGGLRFGFGIACLGLGSVVCLVGSGLHADTKTETEADALEQKRIVITHSNDAPMATAKESPGRGMVVQKPSASKDIQIDLHWPEGPSATDWLMTLKVTNLTSRIVAMMDQSGVPSDVRCSLTNDAGDSLLLKEAAVWWGPDDVSEVGAELKVGYSGRFNTIRRGESLAFAIPMETMLHLRPGVWWLDLKVSIELLETPEAPDDARPLLAAPRRETWQIRKKVVLR